MSSQLILFVVPITLIAFGVDFFVHAAGRVREAQAEGGSPSTSYRTGMTAVLPALTLAAATSIAAFLSNAASGIEAITQFGLAAAVGLGAAYIGLGWLAPRAVLGIEGWVGPAPLVRTRPGLRKAALGVAFAFVAVVAGSMVSMAALVPAVGAVALPLFMVLFVAVPAAIGRRSRLRHRPAGPAPEVTIANAGHGSRSVGALVHLATRWRYVTLAVFAGLGLVGLAGASKVESAFEVSDFFSSKTDFIAGLDRLDQHFGDTVGGPAYIYLEGDLTDPSAIEAIEATLTDLDKADADFARDLDGELIVTPNAADVVRATMTVPGAASNASAVIDIDIEDLDHDGLPDDPSAIEAIYRAAGQQGVIAGDGTVIFTPEQVESFLFVDGQVQATRIELLVTSFTDDAVILQARNVLDASAARLSSTLGSTVPTVSVSGKVIADQDSLAAFTEAMVVSLPIALVVTVVIVGLAIRSVRYSIVTILPILLVVFGVWGYMWARGFTINVVTATIAAIAVGVGIDFCTHFTVRFREELQSGADRFEAIRRTGEGTGGALAISAATSIVGFGIMTAAPAPIFASFGELMALMILSSAVVALLVLPCLLVMVTRPRPAKTVLGPIDRSVSAVAAEHRASAPPVPQPVTPTA